MFTTIIIDRQKRLTILSLMSFLVWFAIGYMKNSFDRDSYVHRHIPEISKGTYSIRNISGLFTPVTVPVFRFNRDYWYKSFEMCRCHEGNVDFPNITSVEMRSILGKFPLYVYSIEEDEIAQNILKTGNYEPKLFQILISILRQGSLISVVNVGHDLGVFTVQFAKLGRQVLHLDFSVKNLRQLCASVLYNNVEFDVTMVDQTSVDYHDEISDCRFTDFKRSTTKTETHGSRNLTSVHTMHTLNHLLDLPHAHQFQRVLIRLDTNGNEDIILINSAQYFNTVDVKGILIGWKHHVHNSETKQRIILFLKERGFSPFTVKGVTKFPINAYVINTKYILWLAS